MGIAKTAKNRRGRKEPILKKIFARSAVLCCLCDTPAQAGLVSQQQLQA